MQEQVLIFNNSFRIGRLEGGRENIKSDTKGGLELHPSHSRDIGISHSNDIQSINISFY